MAGTLLIAATPIGNPGDATHRLAQALRSADVVAAEDTRRLARLARDLDAPVRGEVVSFHESVESARVPLLVQRLIDGATVLLLTDAGMPSVSDPGYRLVAAAAAAGVLISVLPGPSAVLAALAVSGLPSDRFCFEGFPPRKPGERARWLGRLVDEERTAVFFESPRRIGATLAEAAELLGPDRQAAVCRELTKTHEEVRRGTLGELAAWAADGLLGEVTVVVAGSPRPAGGGTPQQWTAAVAEEEAAGIPRREAIKAVAARFGVPKRQVYDVIVAHRHVP